MIDNDYMDQLVAAGPPTDHAIHPTPKLATISAAALQRKDMPPLHFAVEALIPQGLSLLCSQPKVGKSWMVLDLCLSIVRGEKFLGYATNKCNCLYLALEDSERRLKSRLSKLLAGEVAPEGFNFATMSSTVDMDLYAELEDYIQCHPTTGLIVIDTLQRVRGIPHGRETPYATDYREVGILKQFSDKHNIAILLVHHLRKMRDEGDPFAQISGTNGIMGAADTTIVLVQDKRSDNTTTMHVVGRDVEASETVLTFDAETCRWKVVGAATDISAEQLRRQFERNPVVRTIRALLTKNPNSTWVGTATDLLRAGEDVVRQPIADTPRALTAEIQRLSIQLFDHGIDYKYISHGTGGGRHSFRCREEQQGDKDIMDIPF